MQPDHQPAGAGADARALLALVRDMPGTRSGRKGSLAPWIPAQHAAGLLHYARHVARASDGDQTEVDLYESLLQPITYWVPEWPEHVRELAEVPDQRVRLSPQRVAVFTLLGSPLDVLDAAIAVTRHLIRETADGSEVQRLQMDVAEGQQLRFGRTGDVADLTDAIETVRAVLAKTPSDDPMYSNRLNTLGSYLSARFGSTGDSADLDASLETHNRAYTAAPADHEDRPMYLANLGRARLDRYANLSHDPIDLDQGLAELEAAVAASPEGDLSRGTRLSALHRAYRARLARTGRPADLEAALRTAYAAVEATVPGDMSYPERVLDIGATHLARYELTGDKRDASRAIDAARRIMRAAPKGHPLHASAREIYDRARARPR